METILVIDDSRANRMLVVGSLLSLGYNVIEADDGIEGIKKAITKRPALIFMDIQMPNMDGITAMRKIREVPELDKTPVIALTAYAMKGDREKFLAEGFDDYLPKPVAVAGLIDTVKRYLGSKD